MIFLVNEIKCKYILFKIIDKILNKIEIRVYKRFEEILSFRAVMLHNSLQFEFEGNKA